MRVDRKRFAVFILTYVEGDGFLVVLGDEINERLATDINPSEFLEEPGFQSMAVVDELGKGGAFKKKAP